RNLDELVRRIRDLGIEDIAMTTNATALRPLAKRLVDAGLRRINVSLDSVDPDTFRTMTRGGDLTRVIAGIDAIRDAGIGVVKTNSVVVRSQNHTQLADIVDWAWDRDIVPRFIELMPLGEGAKLGANGVVSVAEMKQLLGARLTTDDAQHRADRGPAGYVPAAHRPGKKVGFIGAVTENFCERCNRIRITAKGDIRACLASPKGLSLRDLMRDGHDDDAVLERIHDALFGKWGGHHFHMDGVDAHEHVNMSALGG
ncbi:MAG: radical SAM protein, partial [Myxococcota bacterium]